MPEFNSETGRRASLLGLAKTYRPLRDRLLERIDMKREGCWLWKGATNTSGYGQMSAGKKYTYVLTHRAMWIEHNGPIPKGVKVCHKCDNPPCCNPDHLFLGTMLDNTHDMIKKGRDRKAVGEFHPRSKMTDENVRTLRKLYVEGTTRRKLQEMFGLHKSGVEAIISRRVWKHVL